MNEVYLQPLCSRCGRDDSLIVYSAQHKDGSCDVEIECTACGRFLSSNEVEWYEPYEESDLFVITDAGRAALQEVQS